MDEKQTSETEKDIDSMKGKAKDKPRHESKEEEPNRKKKEEKASSNPTK